MKTKIINGMIPANYSNPREKSGPDSTTLIIKEGRSYKLWSAGKFYTTNRRLLIGIIAFAKTFFSLGFGPIFSKSIRNEWKSFWTGKKVVEFYVPLKNQTLPPITIPTSDPKLPKEETIKENNKENPPHQPVSPPLVKISSIQPLDQKTEVDQNQKEQNPSPMPQLIKKPPIPIVIEPLKMPTLEEKLGYKQELAKQYEEICIWIDSLDLPNEEDKKSVYVQKYSKPYLKNDFKIAQQKALIIVNNETSSHEDIKKEISQIANLKKQLAKILNMEQLELSTYPMVGIPNYGGNNCYLNAAMQVIVHTGLLDYALFRPIMPPLKFANDQLLPPDAPFEPIFEESNYKSIQEMEQAFDIHSQKEKQYREYFKTLTLEQKEALTSRNRYAHLYKDYQKVISLQEKLCSVVSKMRSGQTLTPEDMKSIGGNTGLTSETDHALIRFSIGLNVPKDYQLRVKRLNKDQIENDWISNTNWNILVMGSGHHLWVYVKSSTDRVVKIDDNRVTNCDSLENISNYIKSVREKGINPEQVMQGDWAGA